MARGFNYTKLKRKTDGAIADENSRSEEKSDLAKMLRTAAPFTRRFVPPKYNPPEKVDLGDDPVD